MKTDDSRHTAASCLCALVALVLGIFIGSRWTKGESSESRHKFGVNVRENGSLSTRESGRPSDPSRTKINRIRTEETNSSKFRLEQINNQVHCLREKSKIRMMELKLRLGLSTEQIEKLEHIADEKLNEYGRELMAQHPNSGIGWRVDMLDLADKSLEGMLAENQLTQCHFLKERERSVRIESNALAELAKLNTLNLSEAQRDEVFHILVDKNAANFQDLPLIPDFRALPESELPQATKILEESLERMESVLDPNQLTIYRERLRSELGMLNIIKSD